MNNASNEHRRRLLKRTAFLLAGFTGIGLTASAGMGARETSPSPSTLQLKVHGANWRLIHSNRARGVLPGAGQRSSSFGELLSEPDGPKLGEFYASSFQFGQPFGASEVSASALETHQFNLSDGTIVGIGTLGDLDGGESVHAIIGGTGRYGGATGSYVARQDPFETGGDGTAEFHFNIILRSA